MVLTASRSVSHASTFRLFAMLILHIEMLRRGALLVKKSLLSSTLHVLNLYTFRCVMFKYIHVSEFVSYYEWFFIAKVTIVINLHEPLSVIDSDCKWKPHRS